MTTRSAVMDRGQRTDGGRTSEPSERVTVNITARTSRALDLIKSLTGLNKTDTINRAVQLYAYLEEIVEADGQIEIRPKAGAEPQLLKLF